MGKPASSTRTGNRPPDSTTGPGKALFSGTRQKVLSLLFGQPERGHSISELIERVGSGAVQRAIPGTGTN
jgi:hypothetical protein